MRLAVIGISLMLTSVPVYLLFIQWQSKPRLFLQAIGELFVVLYVSSILHISDSVTLTLQKLLLVMPERH